MLDYKGASKLFRYDPETGIVYWGVDFGRKIKSGKIVGGINSKGYLTFGLYRKTFQLHRLIWLLVNGDWPEGGIDHIDGDKTNNRIDNLRDVSQSENMKNVKKHKRNSSGFTGVRWCNREKKWVANIGVNGTPTRIGGYKSKLVAVIARKIAEKEYGFHANHGDR